MNDAQVLALTQILFPLVVSAAVYLYKKYVPPSKQAQLEHAKSVTRMVVAGVEQTCVALTGPNKKSEATRLITQLLGEAHITVSPTLVDALIEQAVYAINQGKDPQVTQSVPTPTK